MQTTLTDLRVSYSDEGQGIPLLFVHGFPLSRRVWRKQIEALKPSYRAIAPDLRGFGESDTPPSTNTMAQYAEDLHALLMRLETGPVVLIGHSMGGYVAFAFLRQFPEMVKGLVLVGTRADRDTPEAAAARRAMAGKVRAEDIHVVTDAMAPRMLAYGEDHPGMVQQVHAFMNRSQSEGVIGALLGMAERPDATAMLAGISVPTLIVTGSEDALVPPAASVSMAQVIPGARLSMIPHAGHLVAFEQSDAFNRVLKDWLDRQHFTA